MLTLNLVKNATACLKVLCLGCHSDDIEIGCGGTVLQWLSSHENLEIVWVVFTSEGSEREKEARASAALFSERAKKKEVMIKDFRDGFFPFDGTNIKTVFEDELKKTSPDVILTHNGKDAHQDHHQIAELTWNTFRDHLILEYEIPKYDGDMGRPMYLCLSTLRRAKRRLATSSRLFSHSAASVGFRKTHFSPLCACGGWNVTHPAAMRKRFTVGKCSSQHAIEPVAGLR
jgi:LmbE family N-acetylglucosaminyl deacetylase